MDRRIVVPVLLVVGFLAGNSFRPGPVSHAADDRPVKDAPPLRAAHVCMVEFMAKCRKWQAEAAVMNQHRAERAEALTGLKAAAEQKAALVAAAGGAERADLEREAAAALEKYQDAEKAARTDIEGRSEKVLQAIRRQFAGVIADLARERNLDAVYAYPMSPTRGLPAQERDTARALDFYFRPPAVAPIYLRDSADLTDEVVRRMDALYEAEAKKAGK